MTHTHVLGKGKWGPVEYDMIIEREREKEKEIEG